MMYEVTKIIGISILIAWIWLCFEIWRAPLLEMDDNGNWKTIKPAKKLKDLFKTKKQNTSASYSDLEKRGRGRSKF